MTIYNDAINVWGVESQIDVSIGELAELIDVLIKYRRNQCSKDMVIDEIVDVHIMLEQLKIIYNTDDFINKLELKLLKLNDKIEHPEKYRFK